MERGPLVLNFSRFLEEFASRTGAEVVDCTGIGGSRRYCDDDAGGEIRRIILSRLFPGPSSSPSHIARWIDTGDYHYLSAIIASLTGRPFDLVLIDNHPDMQEPAFGGLLSCGGWVRTLLESCGNLGRVGIIGIDPSLACRTEGFGSRVKVLTREDIGAAEGKELEETIRGFISSVTSGNPIYLSLDKDVLDTETYLTNWSQGTMSVGQLETVLETVFSISEVVGADVCGGPSPSGNDPLPQRNLETDVRLWNIIDNLLKKQYLCRD